MEELFLEMLKLGDVAAVRGVLMFSGAWYIVSAKLTKPLNERMESLQEEIRGLGDTLRDVETSHARQLSLLEQDLGHTKIRVEELSKKTDKILSLN